MSGAGVGKCTRAFRGVNRRGTTRRRRLSEDYLAYDTCAANHRALKLRWEPSYGRGKRVFLNLKDLGPRPQSRYARGARAVDLGCLGGASVLTSVY